MKKVEQLHKDFIELIRLGIGHKANPQEESVDWSTLKNLAERQGLSAVVLDGLDKSKTDTLPLQMKLEWIGEVLQNYEQRYVSYEKAIGSLACFYNQNGFKIMVLKGYACSLDWPKPNHRPCGDIDIWQFGEQKEADAALTAWLNSSSDSRVQGFEIDNSHHHHTVFDWKGFVVENHYDFVNMYSHKKNRELESVFKRLGKEDLNYVEVNGEKVYLPSPNLHALFLIRHMISHFAAAEITLRQVLDWAFFVEKHTKKVDWKWLLDVLEEYHMKDFFYLINAICVEDLGFSVEIFPIVQFHPDLKRKVLKDIIEPEYGTAEPDGLIKRIAYKYRRWQGNAWKQKMCYGESRWSAFMYGIWAKLLKPASF